ncbi:hypothetical protein Tco_1422977 [Tanacetum coccineum]
MGTYLSSLSVSKKALILSVEATIYITNTSPLIGAVSVCRISMSFFILRKASSASVVHRIVFLSVKLLSALKKGSYFLAPFERNWLSADSFPLRLCMSLSVFGGSESVTALSFEGLALSPCSYVKSTVPIPLGVWNFMAPWIIDTSIPIFCIAVLPSNSLGRELDHTMKKVRVSFLMKGLSPIVISKGISPRVFSQEANEHLDKLERSPWLGPLYGGNLSLFSFPLLLSQEGRFLNLSKLSRWLFGAPLVAASL